MPGSMTTCLAARTTTPPTGPPPRRLSRPGPDLAFGARANRAFLGRAVRYRAAEAGIHQFLDIGTGIPTAGNLHEVAQAIAPQTRVVYVDYDRCKPGCTHAR